MPKQQRAKIPENTFSTTNPLTRLISTPGVASETPQIPAPGAGNRGQDLESGAGQKLKKETVYITAGQKAKLEDLAKAHRKKEGSTMNWQEALRVIIDASTEDDFLK